MSLVDVAQLLFGLTAFGIAGALFFFCLAPFLFDRLANRSAWRNSAAIPEPAKGLHRTLTVVDLHCDALIAPRDLSRRHTGGHVDIPRLVDGNVALQVFTIPTMAPVRAGIRWMPTDADAITLYAAAQRWPRRALTSTRERALFAAKRLHTAEAGSQGLFRIIRSVKQLDTYLHDRRDRPSLTAGLLGIEGLHCLEGTLENVDVFHDAGVRLAGLVHLAGNALGGEAEGRHRGGISDFGIAVLRRLEEKHILVDLSHASPALIDDLLDRSTRPMVVSHTGLRGVHDTNRNLSDAHALRIARQGGVLGIAFFPKATGGRDVASIIRSILYAVALVGVDHVALGSDFDGMVATPFDVSGMALITAALMAEGLSDADIAKIMGDNALRLLRETLPPE